MPSNPAHELIRRSALAMSARPISLAWPGGVVSFTFDDFPKSALAIGGRILERYNVRGTYYAAMKLAGTNDILGPMFDAGDILAAHGAGHEIACHTFTHVDCRTVPKSVITTEICQNATAFGALIEGFVPTNFAYPYGSISVMAKRLLGAKFSSCRGIGRGINHDIADLADLLAVQIYDIDFDEAEMQRLIERIRRIGGWLIFFSHDVADKPSAYGCTPDQLERVVAYAAARTTILPVRDVIAGLDCHRSNLHSLIAKYSFALKKIKRRYLKTAAD
jgi:peptidoglycan/xylan/chitin deacetylase (PgdA/CDA1 family)